MMFPQAIRVRSSNMRIETLIANSGFPFGGDFPVKVEEVVNAYGEIRRGYAQFIPQSHVPISPGDSSDMFVYDGGEDYVPARAMYQKTATGVLGTKGSGLRGWKGNMPASVPRRVLPSECGIELNDKSTELDPLPQNPIVLYRLFHDKDGLERRLPIYVNCQPRYSSHYFVGGADLKNASQEFVGALILHILCKRAGVKAGTYVPLTVMKPEELPTMGKSITRIVGPDRYCEEAESFDGDMKYRTPNKEEFDKLAVLLRFGERIDRRVPFLIQARMFGLTWDIPPWYLYKDKTIPDREKAVMDFVETLGRTVLVAQVNGFCFSRIGIMGIPISALTPDNVSHAGETMDLDTFRADARLFDARADLKQVRNTIGHWAAAHELPGDGVVEEEGYKYPKPSLRLKEKALDRFSTLVEEAWA